MKTLTRKQRWLPGLVVVSVLAWAGSALADANITVDGLSSDWNLNGTNCFKGSLTGSGVKLTEICTENNNSTGDVGSLFALFVNNSSLSTNKANYFGLELDLNNDGSFDTGDEIFLAFFPAGSTTATQLNVYNTSFTLLKSYGTTTCGGTSDSDGWKAVLNGTNVELSIAYGCLQMAHCNDSRFVTMMGVTSSNPSLGNMATLSNYYINGSTDASAELFMAKTTTTPDSTLFTAVAATGQVTLNWNNPQRHEGVVVLQSAGTPIASSLTLTNGTAYTAGQTVSGAQVVYSDRDSCSTSYTGTSLSPGVTYYYRLYNHDEHYTYAPGNVPSSSGLYASPSDGGTLQPIFCYSEGFPDSQQPVSLKGVAVYSAGNLGAVTANQTSSSVATEGQELWRPVQLKGAVQTRPPVVPLYGRTGNYILTGDQSGYTYAIDASSGSIVWNGLGGGTLGTAIQAQPVVQLYNYANATFQAANPGRDLVFFGTRNTSATNNTVAALSSVDGSKVWSYTPGNLDIINGGGLVDYTNNRLWIASRSNGGAQASLRVLNSLTGALLASFSDGDIDYGVNLDAIGGQVMVANNTGTVYGYDLTSMTQLWSVSTGGTPSSYAYPIHDLTLGSGFIISLNASVVRYTVSGSTVTQLWSTPVPGPSGVSLYFPSDVYVGGSDGRLYELDVGTGAIVNALSVSAQALGMPSVDQTAARASVGGLDGRICQYAVPY